MGVFFSGTDMSCLHDQAPSHDMFLSVIVNTQGHKIAKLAVVVEIEQKVSFKLMKKLFKIATEAEKHLAIFNCNVFVDGEKEWKAEYDEVLKESKAKQPKHAPTAKKNYSAPEINKKGQLEMYEPPLITDTTMLEQLSDINIENLIVRSISIDELESRSLEEVIPETREQLPDGDQADMVSMMVDHFEYALRDEYKFGQFGTVLDKSKRLLSDYRNFRFVNQFILGLDNLGKYYKSNWVPDGMGGDGGDRGTPEDRRDYIAFSEIEDANEF